jgi:Undecaprenyl-phosphate glucose phosphotransferase
VLTSRIGPEHILADTFAASHAPAVPRGRRVSLHRVVAIVFLLDCTILTAAGFAPILIRELWSGAPPAMVGADVIVLTLAIFLACQKLFGAYRRKRLLSDGQSVRRTFVSLFVTFSLLMMLGAAAKATQDYSRIWFFSWMALSLGAIPIVRWCVIARLRRELAQGAYVYRALSIGIFCRPLDDDAIWRRTRGLTRVFSRMRLLDAHDLATLDETVREGEIDEIYISVPWHYASEVFEQLNGLQHLSANVFVSASTEDHIPPFLAARVSEGQVQLKLLDRAIEGWDSWQKRCLDLTIAYMALLALAPVLGLTALAIKLESRGPVLFRQTRQGFNGRTFELLKFRSMFTDKSDAFAEKQTSKGDPRVTRVGRWIRRLSIDELPQLFNVIRGDMSIVGPRPHALKTTAEGRLLNHAVREYAFRHRVKPGMTGWAQVNGLRGELDSIDKLRRRVQHDIDYIKNWSMLLDVRILLKTLRIVLLDRTAY